MGVPLTVKAAVPSGVARVVVTVSALVVDALGTPISGLRFVRWNRGSSSTVKEFVLPAIT